MLFFSKSPLFNGSTCTFASAIHTPLMCISNLFRLVTPWRRNRASLSRRLRWPAWSPHAANSRAWFPHIRERRRRKRRGRRERRERRAAMRRRRIRRGVELKKEALNYVAVRDEIGGKKRHLFSWYELTTSCKEFVAFEVFKREILFILYMKPIFPKCVWEYASKNNFLSSSLRTPV